MKRIAVIHINDGEQTTTVNFLGETIEIIQVGCHGDPARAEEVLRRFDGTVDAIGLEGMPAQQITPFTQVRILISILLFFSPPVPLQCSAAMTGAYNEQLIIWLQQWLGHRSTAATALTSIIMLHSIQPLAMQRYWAAHRIMVQPVIQAVPVQALRWYMEVMGFR